MPAAVAQPIAELSADLTDAQAAHLWRVGAWGATSLVAGATILVTSDAEQAAGRRAFALQSAAWGAINLGIAAVGLAAGPPETTTMLTDALAAEERYGDILWINTGLNVGYIAVGATLYAVGARAGVGRAQEWKGHGLGVVMQGVGLLVLDGVALIGSQRRAGDLLDVLRSVDLAATGSGMTVVISL